MERVRELKCFSYLNQSTSMVWNGGFKEREKMYSLIRIGVIVLGSEASHEIAIIPTHHLLHVFEVMGWWWALGSTQRGSIWWRSWMAGR